MHTTSSEVFQVNRKRRIDWSPSLELTENGPDSKIPSLGKDQRNSNSSGSLNADRRKSQGNV